MIGDAAEGDDVLVHAGIGDAALHEADVHAEGTVRESLQVFLRTFRWENLQSDAIAAEKSGVAFGISIKAAARWTGGDGDGSRGREMDEVKNRHEGDNADDKNSHRSDAAAEPEQFYERAQNARG